ncbi:hypothetical protein CKO25_07330 [Thiocapsa imhoffii]|uniref:Uncharacterized protein n=1 Tax=Thiocapsa imhoffii TaxID=382777 RepID=A0A9X0WH45_9GAMM|nr:hypothetical protein [Thiocapsa imhoffii]
MFSFRHGKLSRVRGRQQGSAVAQPEAVARLSGAAVALRARALSASSSARTRSGPWIGRGGLDQFGRADPK